MSRIISPAVASATGIKRTCYPQAAPRPDQPCDRAGDLHERANRTDDADGDRAAVS